MQVQAYYDRTNRYEPNLGEQRDTFDVDLISQTNVGRRQQFIYGAGVRFSDGRFLEVGSGLVFSPANRTDYLLSGFFEDDITLISNKLALNIGTKVLRTNFTDFSVEPSARLLWTPNEKNTLWAAFTRAIRTPSRAEHDFYLSSYLGVGPGDVPVFARFNANPDFASEQLNGYEFGYRTLIRKNLFIDFAGFWNHYHDLFSQDFLGGPALETSLPFPEPVPPPVHTIFTAQFRNDLYGFTTGGEIAPEWRPTPFWRLRGSYSYLNMNLSTSPGPALGGTPESVAGSSPRHQVVGQSSFDIGRRLQVDLIYRYVSALPAVSAPGYSTADARFAWRFTPGFEFSVVGRSLFQPWHIEYAADPGGPIGVRRGVFAALAFTR